MFGWAPIFLPEQGFSSASRVCSMFGWAPVFLSRGGFIWEFPKIGVPYLGVLIIRILLFRVLY